LIQYPIIGKELCNEKSSLLLFDFIAHKKKIYISTCVD